MGKMRELKFRVWNKTMHQYRHFVLQKGVSVSIGADLEIEQYTGLKDKNGKEIYEGDIVSDGYGKVLVEYSTTDVWSCGCCNEKFYGAGFIVTDGSDPDNWEVIGNIHESPELLEREDAKD